MPLIECRTLFNQKKLIPLDKLVQRPSAYGIILSEGQILLAKATITQKYVLPGGGIEIGESNEVALRREVWEETGAEVEVARLLHFETDFFYYDPLDSAVHGFLVFYQCFVTKLAFSQPNYPPEEDLDMALWVDIADLKAEAFQSHGEIALRLIEQCRT